MSLLDPVQQGQAARPDLCDDQRQGQLQVAAVNTRHGGGGGRCPATPLPVCLGQERALSQRTRSSRATNVSCVLPALLVASEARWACAWTTTSYWWCRRRGVLSAVPCEDLRVASTSLSRWKRQQQRPPLSVRRMLKLSQLNVRTEKPEQETPRQCGSATGRQGDSGHVVPECSLSLGNGCGSRA
jgi:hypothetical protein